MQLPSRGSCFARRRTELGGLLALEPKGDSLMTYATGTSRQRVAFDETGSPDISPVSPESPKSPGPMP